MITIELKRDKWQYDPLKQIGKEGGFGVVYKGISSDGKEVAVKQLTLRAGASGHRELNMADVLADQDLQHVIPVLDAGQDIRSNECFVIMALAAKSLQEEIEQHRILTESQAIEIARNIVEGLLEVDEIVHRDLKPANVLFHAGLWKLADFGIARLVEANTSENTMRRCLSPQYAAPEQWNWETVTKKTDVYALGCVLYEMLSGTTPFPDAEPELLRQQHLQEVPRELSGTEPGFRRLVAAMLRKSASSRPDLDRILPQLEALQRGPQTSPGRVALREAAAHVEVKDAEREARTITQNIEEARRKAIAREGNETLDGMQRRIFEQITEEVPDAEVNTSGGVATFALGKLQLDRDDPNRVLPKRVFERSGWDAVTTARITVHQRGKKPYQWGAALVYAIAKNDNDFRWWELCFMYPENKKKGMNLDEPFGSASLAELDQALSLSEEGILLAAPPHPIDDEDFGPFAQRWFERFAAAIKGELARPSHLPLIN